MQQALLVPSRYLAGFAQDKLDQGNVAEAIALARQALPKSLETPERPLVPEAIQVLYDAYAQPQYGLRTLVGHEGAVSGALQLIDGRLLTWSDDKTARLWSADGTPGSVLRGHQEAVSGALQLIDGRLLTWSDDKTARLWSADGEPGRVLKGHDEGVSGALQLRDGRLLTWSADRTARLWSADGWPGPVPLALLRGHDEAIRGMLLLRAGRLLTWSSGALQHIDGRLLTWSEDTTTRLWSIDGTPGPVLKGHGDAVLGALQLRDGRLLTRSADNTARLWFLPDGLLAWADRQIAAQFPFSPAERCRYFLEPDDKCAASESGR